MGERPRGTSLDRVNVNEDYKKDNCRWSGPKRQQRNRRNNRIVVFEGEEMPLVVLAERTGVPYQRLRSRIVEHGWTAEDAVKKPSIGFF